jgi:transcriptional regulator with XRE-family HTH domain
VGGIGQQATIAKIENEKRSVSLDEALALAEALGVAPVYLIMPLDDASPPVASVDGQPRSAREARDARRWFTSLWPPPPTVYTSTAPAGTSRGDLADFEQARRELAASRVERYAHLDVERMRWLADDLRDAVLTNDIEARADALEALEDELGRQRRELERMRRTARGDAAVREESDG